MHPTGILSFYISILFPVKGASCGDCTCRYIQDIANVYNCSSIQMVKLPSTVPEGINWLDASNNYLTELCDSPSYLRNVSSLNVGNNEIRKICDNVMAVLEVGNLQDLNLHSNKIEQLPKQIMHVTPLKRLWLSGNPYLCDCRTIWMKELILNSSSYVQDAYDVMCASGVPLRALDFLTLKCYPGIYNLTPLNIVFLLCVLVVFVAATVVSYRKRNEVRWLLYLHFGISFKRDKDINIAEMDYDCYLSYW